MSELPEVEVLRKELEKEVVGKRFKDVTVKSTALVSRHRNRPEFVKALQGHKIEGLSRRGTTLLFELDGDQVLVVRLGHHASLTRETATEEPGKHTHMVATFTTGGSLHYADMDKGGQMFVTSMEELAQLPEFAVTGIDPLADTFTWPAFSERLKQHGRTLKQALLDEQFLVGLGEVYSDEVLWAAGLSGSRKPESLTSQEVRRLYRAVLEVLYEAVKQGGTSTESSEPDDEELEYGEFLKVYGREGDACARCRQPIRHGLVEGVASYFCRQCQT